MTISNLKNRKYLWLLTGLLVAVFLFSGLNPVLATDDAADPNTDQSGTEATDPGPFDDVSTPDGNNNGNADTPAAPKKEVTEAPDSTWTEWIANFLNGVISVFIKFIGNFLALELRVLVSIMSYNDFVTSQTVKNGWTLVRDVANLFFIVILLAIAIGTILKIESYNLKRLLPKVLIMAVLVNFSRTICGLIIDAAQVVMMTFAAAFLAGKAESNFIGIFRIHDIVNAETVNTSGSTVVLSSVVVSGLLAIVMMLIAMVVVLVFMVVFLMRIVMLWLLVVLSPLPYILTAFSQGQKYAQQWWQEFSKYVIIGPILAFFLWLTFSIASTGDGGISGEEISGDLDKDRLDAAVSGGDDSVPGMDNGKYVNKSFFTAIGDSSNFISFVIAIGMLMGSLMITQQMGVAGGSLAGQASNFIRRAGMKTPLMLGAWTARKIKAGHVPLGIGRLTKGLELNPMNIFRGFRESFAERKKFEEMEGRSYSGAAMEKGGIRGLVKGLGTSRDWADAYVKGFANLTGFGRMALSVRGRPKTVDKIFAKVDSRKREILALDRQRQMRQEALDLSDNDILDYARQEIQSDVHINMRAKEIRDLMDNDKATEEERRKYSKRKTRDADGTETEIDIADAAVKQGITTGITVEQLRKDGRIKEAEDLDQFFNDWYKAAAAEEIGGEFAELSKKFANGDAKARDEVQENSRRYLQNQAAKARDDAYRLKIGQISVDESDANNRKLVSINEQIENVLRQIKEGVSKGISVGPLQEQWSKLIEEGQSIGGKYDANAKRFYGLDEFAPDMPDQVKEPKKWKEWDRKRQEQSKDKTAEAQRYQTLAESINWSSDERRQARLDIEEYKKKAEDLQVGVERMERKGARRTPPRAFYAARDRRLLENEELHKITTDLDTELIAAFRDALRDGDKTKATAIFKKLASDGNDNEILNAFGFASNSQGMHDFINAVFIGKKKREDGTTIDYDGPSLHFDDQTAYAIENDIAFINEGVNHWETARLIDVDRGRYSQMTEKQHTEAAMAEIMKKNTREITRSYNRLAYGGEVPRADGSGRDFKISPLGLAILTALGPEIGANIQRGEYNKNAVMNIGKILSELEKYDVDSAYISHAGNAYGKLRSEAGENIGKIVDEVFRKQALVEGSRRRPR